VVERLDRLARTLMVQELLLRECRDRNIKVYAADQGLVDQASDGGDPTRKLIRQVLGAVAEWEKSALVKKLYAAKQRTGRWGGAKPYGTLNDTEKRIKAAIIGWQPLYGYNRIAEMLNMVGDTNRHGRPWTRDSVRDVIKGRNRNERKLHTAPDSHQQPDTGS
jgi:DNA invertase Pin-like site-specific DNA recombinase